MFSDAKPVSSEADRTSGLGVCVCVCACTPEPLLNTQANLKHQAVLLVIICVNLPSVFEWTALSQGYRSQELLTKQY